ncbi:MAG: hypothetical protein ACI97N_000950 [Cognaticolwellia sp.]|jgi:hypothetical protein
MSFEEEQYEAARNKVKLKKSFYRHLASYIIVGAFFFIMNMTTSPNDIWFHFPMMGWGIGLAFHYIRVFGVPYIGTLDNAWEEQEIEKELSKMKGRSRNTSKQLSSESHEIDELDLDNKYHFDKEELDLEKWDNYENRDLKEIRKDFDDQFKR